jgi:hypothetical protein
MRAAFPQFPKTRPPLPAPLAALHRAAYADNRGGATPAARLSLWMESWLHRQVARDVVDDPRPRCTLEIGAGTLNQLPWEPGRGPYDIVEPFAELYRDSPHRPRVRTVFADIGEIPVERRYDRITSIATFEHLCDLPRVVATAAARLAPGGELRVGIPSEGTLPWALGWRLTTGLEFRLRHGLDYGLLMRHEHVNTAAEIEAVLRYCFGDVRCRTFGPARRLSLYQFFACRDPAAHLT